MKHTSFKNGEFVTTATKPSQYPTACNSLGAPVPEIAFAGRSNVGKSTLINHLLNTRKLVKASSTPGKTQHLNFFLVDESLMATDLPGYGFARVPANVRKKWGPMVQTYLEERPPLKLILFLLDIRRIPNEDDLQFLDWAIHQNKAVILVLTKCDKVKANERKRNKAKILEKLGVENLHTVYYSALKNEGRRQLVGMINEAVADEWNEEE